MKFTSVALLGCVLACLLVSAVAKDKDVKELQIGVKVNRWSQDKGWAQAMYQPPQPPQEPHDMTSLFFAIAA
jgi:hypothetical protein